ncbi:MAG TPA: ABC transporter ATP-binding protein [Rectinemataceae bacterium]|nr:ABC transporter ATP-binding protein [Rectinemataceae bacterium]
MKDFKTISVRHMTKRFGDKTAVSDFSLEFGKGEFVTFLGPSGCGKSTALNCVTGLIPITSGEIWIDDECIDNADHQIPPEKREFGMVFQNYALFPHLSVAENVAFGLKLRKLKKAEVAKRVDDALRLVHLEGYAHKFPAQMSGGEQQRVAIARCVVLEPRLLLLDEPLSNLDAKLRIELRYELKALHERLKVTTIYVTHDQTEALALSDRIVVLRSGKIQQVGSPTKIYSDPANMFVADFMGFRNRWPAKIESIEEKGPTLVAKFSAAGSTLEAHLAYPADDPRRVSLLAAHKAGAAVTTAIRPEDLALGDGASNHIRCTAEIVEYQGNASQVGAVAGAGVRVDFRSGTSVAEGEALSVSVPPDKILLFAAEDQDSGAGVGP